MKLIDGYRLCYSDTLPNTPGDMRPTPATSALLFRPLIDICGRNAGRCLRGREGVAGGVLPGGGVAQAIPVFEFQNDFQSAVFSLS